MERRHSHGNKALLDTIAAANVHSHGNKAQLDLVTDGDHDVRTDNPHATDVGNLGAGTLAELNAALSDADVPGSAHGVICWQDNATATVITTQSVYTKVAGTSALSAHATAKNFDMPANNRLRYTGTRTIVVQINYSISVRGVGANDGAKTVVYKNGTVDVNNEYTAGTAISCSTGERKLGGAGDLGSASGMGYATMATNDYIELAIANLTDADDLVVKHLSIGAHAIE